MSEIQGVGRLTFHHGKIEEFKRLSAQVIDVVRARDTGTLQFAIYLSTDESECVIFERYRDSQAVIEHGMHVAGLMPAIFATGSIKSQLLLGEPSAELAAMTACGGISIFRPLLSMPEPSGATRDNGVST